MRSWGPGPALAAVLSLATSSCADPSYEVHVHLPGDPAAATRIELSILRSCDGVSVPGDPAVTVIKSIEIRGEPGDLGAIAPGSYGLYGRAWQGGCVLYAAGCAPVTVEGGGDGALDVYLVAVSNRGCAADEECIDERCAPPGGCLGAGSPCSAPASCCSGLCAGGSCASGDCVPDGFGCSTNAQCCGQVCLFGFCLGAESCAETGGSCVLPADCCAGSCQSGRCSTALDCRQQNDLCALDADCCSRSCLSTRCAGLPGCTVAGERCYDDSECCSADCSGSTCQAADDCRPAGEVCPEGPDVCCGGLCQGDPPRCAHAGGCLPFGEICYDDSECCSDDCFADRCD